MRRLLMPSILATAVVCAGGTSANADTIIQGFEGGGFTLSGTAGSSATISTSPVHSGVQAVNLSGPGTGDAEVDVNVSSASLTLGNITSGNYWVNLISGTNANAPYIYFPVTTPGGTAYVVMFNPHDMGIDLTTGVWTDISIDPNTTAFHVEGDTTGIADPGGLTLAELVSSDYSAGVTWGSFAVNQADIEMGQEGDASPSNYNVDDLTLVGTVPEPASMALLGSGLFGLGVIRRRRGRKLAV
jgi:hypothetical protein